MPTILLLIAALAAVAVEGTATCKKKLDFLVSVDASSTVCGGTAPCPEWYAILDFAKDLVKTLTVGKYDSRVAFVTFANRTKVEWNLDRYDNEQSVLTAIDNIKYPGGELIDVVSVSKIILDVYNPLYGDRRNVANIGILVTDGAPNYPDEVYGAESLAIQADAVPVFVVCKRPGCTEKLAKELASPPWKVGETYFLIDDYLSIGQVTDRLVNKFCNYNLEQALKIL